MPVHIDLGSLSLSCPSIGLDLLLTSNAFFSTLAQRTSLEPPSITDIESGRTWTAPATNFELLIDIVWPSCTSRHHLDSWERHLLTAFQHAALWTQLNLQPSLTIQPSTGSDERFLVAIALTSVNLNDRSRKAPVHRLGKDVPLGHLKAPEGVSSWTLDRVRLRFDMGSNSRPAVINQDIMLLENSTLLGAAASHTFVSTEKEAKRAAIVTLIDTAFRLAITRLPAKALSGIKILERSSFKHLDDICPAMWSPNYLEAVATRAVFLPTISHAVSSFVQRSQSNSLREKLRDIARQEYVIETDEPRDLQKAVNLRLWRLMQCRLHDPSAGKGLKSILAECSTLPISEPEQDVDDIWSIDHKIQPQANPQCNDPDLFEREIDLDILDVDYDSGWEDLFVDQKARHDSMHDDMLDSVDDVMLGEDAESLPTSIELSQRDMFEEEMIDIEDCDSLHIV